MKYYPVFLDINNRRSVVVGGGKVAERKVRGLLDAGALVCVVSPGLTPGLRALARAGRIRHIKGVFEKGALKGAVVAVAASDSKEVNAGVFKEAGRRGVPVNTVDDIKLCSFIVPSVIRRGDLTIAISTAGKAPALAKKLRRELSKTIGAEYGQFTRLIGRIRNNLLKRGADRVKKERVIKALIDSPLPALIRSGNKAKAEAVLKKILGEGFSPSGTFVIKKAPSRKTAAKG